ncbi:MAG: hypothetical protein J5871_03890 [Bacteroidales bacterium]|nr:hypothetical protein [Bacteroidales bacterium]
MSVLLSSCGIVRLRQSPAYQSGRVDGTGLRGRVEAVRYPCSVPGPHWRRMIVYLPEGYDTSSCRYPVMYLLHGARGYETSWIRKGNVLHLTDSLFAGGHAVPAIVVMPNMNQYNDDYDYENGRFKDAMESLFEVDGIVESAFCEDVVAFVDARYRTVPEGAYRAVGGLSIGAMQSAYLCANHPGMFGYVGVFSPMWPPMGKENPRREFYRHYKEKNAALFRQQAPVWYLMTGRADILHFISCGWHRFLQKQDAPHIYHVSGGGHSWANWQDYYVRMMSGIFKDSVQ